jgi:replication factor C subunit 3/5
MHKSEDTRRVQKFITMLTVVSSDQITEKTPIPPPDWEALIEVIAKDMIDERSPARILQVRAKLYDLLTHCIPATTILKVCLWALSHPGRQSG